MDDKYDIEYTLAMEDIDKDNSNEDAVYPSTGVFVIDYLYPF